MLNKIIKIVLILLLICFSVNAADPSPYSKQLRIAIGAYSGSAQWQYDNIRDWSAERYADIIGIQNGTVEDADSMHIINPELTLRIYQLYALDTSEISDVQDWADSVGCSFDSMVIRAKTGENDTLRCRIQDFEIGGQAESGTDSTIVDNDKNWSTNYLVNSEIRITGGQGEGSLRTVKSNTSTEVKVTENWGQDSIPNSTSLYSITKPGFSRWVKTEPGGILLTSGFTNAQTRFAFDYRNPLVGAFLAYKYKKSCAQYHADGVHMDEEACVGYTGNVTEGRYNIYYPFRYGYPAGSDKLWDTTGYNPWYHTQNAWDSTLTHYKQGSVPDSGSVVRDSLRILRNGWQKALGDSMESYDLLLVPNFAGDPYLYMNNWDNEVRHAAILCKGVLMGEFCYYYPSTVGCEDHCNRAVKGCYSVRDSSVSLWVRDARMGQYEMSSDMTLGRTQINALGFWLDCFFPGNSTYYFRPCNHTGQVQFKMNRTLNGITLDDTTTLWNYSWGKYFGEALDTRDTSQTGTDPQSQGYTIHKIALLIPNSNDTLTYAIGRYCRGNNRNISQTQVSVNLPSGNWYELDTVAHWSGPYTSSINIANAQWRIFSSDTVLSNTGIEDTSIVQVLTCTDTTTTSFDLSDNFTLSNTVVDTVIFECSTDDWASVAKADTVENPSDLQTSTLSGLNVETQYKIRCRAWDTSESVIDTSNVLTISTLGEGAPTAKKFARWREQ